MGGFYTNYTLRGPGPKAVATALKGRRAFVAGPFKNFVVVCDEASDHQDVNQISKLAEHLSQEFVCPVLAVVNHDDDVLWYRLYVGGVLKDEYDSWPGYFDPSADHESPRGGNAKELCAAFGVRNVVEIEKVLRKTSLGDEGYVFAHRRHADLVRLLNLPSVALAAAYASFAGGQYPERSFSRFGAKSTGRTCATDASRNTTQQRSQVLRSAGR